MTYLMTDTLLDPLGKVLLAPLPDGRFRVTLQPRNTATFVELRTCETAFPVEIIQFLLQKGIFPWLCDCLARHEDPAYVIGAIERQVLAYFPREAFVGKRLLDFGCGSGASTLALAKLFPDCEMVGVELNDTALDIARRIQTFHHAANVSFLRSPDGDSLPPGIGWFDFVMLSAVYEHLLPRERRTVMPLLWSSVNPGGAILINQTPHRYFPKESHSTGLWFLNYMPDWLACYMATNHSRYNFDENRRRDWKGHLRGGIRGGTERRMLRDLLANSDGDARILQPNQGGLRDRADYWLSGTSSAHRGVKRALTSLFRVTDRLLATIPASHVDVVIQRVR